MSRLRFVSACVAAVTLILSCPGTMAQGVIEPPPSDSLLSPDPLGPSQKFGDLSPGSRLQQAPTPRPRQAHAARDAQTQSQRGPGEASRPRPMAQRSLARRLEPQGGTVGSVSSLAPRYGERRPTQPFCFPSSTIHVAQDARCNVGVPTYRGRFEELLGE